MDELGGKWKILIIYILSRGETHYGKLLFILPNISNKVLSQNLKKLENSDFVQKKEKNQDQKVFYSLTKKSESLFPILHAMSKWTREMYPEEHFEDCYVNYMDNDE